MCSSCTYGGRIGYQKVCKAEDDEAVPDEEIVKAFELKKAQEDHPRQGARGRP